MFQELLPMLRKGETFVLNITYESDANVAAPEPGGPLTSPMLRVNVIPKLFTLDGQAGDDRKALNTPLTITGTAAELDSPDFVATLQRFTSSVSGLRQSIDDVEAAHNAAKGVKAAAAKAKPKESPKAETKADKAEEAKPKPEPPKPTEQPADLL
jgi:PRTRC genetic system protein E